MVGSSPAKGVSQCNVSRYFCVFTRCLSTFCTQDKRTNTHVNACAYAYTCTRTHTLTVTDIRTQETHIRQHARTRANASARAHSHTHMYMYTHAHIAIHIHYIHVLRRERRSGERKSVCVLSPISALSLATNSPYSVRYAQTQSQLKPQLKTALFRSVYQPDS